MREPSGAPVGAARDRRNDPNETAGLLPGRFAFVTFAFVPETGWASDTQLPQHLV
jgi:hypothetical protein